MRQESVDDDDGDGSSNNNNDGENDEHHADADQTHGVQMDIVVDVGAEYDPTRHRYDHHQKEF
eukprot:881669-Rhodomonas_salina.1